MDKIEISFAPLAKRTLSDHRLKSLSAACFLGFLSSVSAYAAELHVMKTGLGDGLIEGPSLTCGVIGGVESRSCSSAAPPASVTLSARVGPGAIFVAWGGDCAGVPIPTPPATPTCTVSTSSVRRVRGQFNRLATLPTISDFTPEGINTFLLANREIDTPAEFVAALPQEFRENWVAMTRSESLQTGVAEMPRFLLPSADARRVFTLGLKEHSSYPGSHPLAIEYMQWDATEKNFRFHEIVIGRPDDPATTDVEYAIAAMGDVIDPGPPAKLRFKPRLRGVAVDDPKCFACHSTRNVKNLAPDRISSGATPGTTGTTPQTIKHKSKPNWDTYDSWGGMLPFNRDRIYKNTVEAAAFRKLFNLWTWQTNDGARAVIEQLRLQPTGVPVRHEIGRLESGGPTDGQIWFAFDRSNPAAPGVPAPVSTEGQPTGSGPTIAYEFDRRVASNDPGDPNDDPSEVKRENVFVTLHHSADPTNDEGRGVQLFDLLGGLDGQPNAIRIADDMIPKPPLTRHVATSDVEIDVRPFALAITDRCITVAGAPAIGAVQTVAGPSTALIARDSFFSLRNGLNFDQVYDDTRRRQQSLTLRKAEIQRANLDRDRDVYVLNPGGPMPIPPANRINGLIREHGGATAGITGGTGGADQSLARLRQEVFRRPGDDPLTSPPPHPDETVMGRVYPDRENDSTDGTADNTAMVALFRYYLEPFGVSVDKWSMNVRGRSRAYNFADVLGNQTSVISSELKASLGAPGIPCTSPTIGVDTIMARVDAELLRLFPDGVDLNVRLQTTSDQTPSFTDIQRLFNKSCIECHGGLGYPPYQSYGTYLDLSENEDPSVSAAYPANRRLGRSHQLASSLVSAPSGAGVNCTDFRSSTIYRWISDNCLLAHPYNPAEPYDAANPNNPADPDVADERCPEGLMPCGGPPLSKTDIETVKRWIKGTAPYAEGDPHVKTVDGVSYDFQSAGEFTLLRDEGMELQARLTAVTTAGPLPPNPHTGLSSCVSVNTAVAMRVGAHRVTYQPELSPVAPSDEFAVPGQIRRLVLRIDGKETSLERGEIPLRNGGRVKRAPAPDAIQVELPGGSRVVVTPGWWDSQQIWYMNINAQHVRARDGVMGAIAPGGWLPALSNGDQLGRRPRSLADRHRDLYQTFAQSWRVDDMTSLFDYENGLSAGSFVLPTWPESAPNNCLAPPQPGGPVRGPAPAPIAEAEAEALCAAVVDPERRRNCVVDVMATGEPGFAETYAAGERLDNRRLPAPPQLTFPEDNARLPGSSIDFTWSPPAIADAPGVRYRHCIRSGEEMFDLNRCVKLGESQTGFGSVVDRLPPEIANRLTPEVCLAIAAILLLIAIILIARWRWRGLLLVLILAGIFAAFLYALSHTRSASPLATQITNLSPNKVYYWKVVADLPDGLTVESETRRFEVSE